MQDQTYVLLYSCSICTNLKWPSSLTRGMERNKIAMELGEDNYYCLYFRNICYQSCFQPFGTTGTLAVKCWWLGKIHQWDVWVLKNKQWPYGLCSGSQEYGWRLWNTFIHSFKMDLSKLPPFCRSSWSILCHIKRVNYRGCTVKAGVH